MGIDDLAGKAKGAASGEKGEQLSDAGIEKGEDAATKAAGGKHGDQIGKAGDAADKRIGGQ